MERVLRIAVAVLRLGALEKAIVAMRRRVMLYAVVGIVALVTAVGLLTWLTIALYLYCATQISPALAAIVVAGAFLIILLAAGLAIVLARPRRAPPKQPASALSTELERFLRNNKNSLLLAAIVAGLVIGSTRPRR
jgi:hypothetical protein